MLDALDELLRLDLVRHTDVPRRFRFRHPLVRRAVYELTPGGRRLRAHERCARALPRARRTSVSPGASRRVRRPRGRPERSRSPPRSRRSRSATSARECRAVVGERSAPPPADRAQGGADRAPPRPGHLTRRHRPLRRGACVAARGSGDRSRRRRGAARSRHHRVCDGRAPARPPEGCAGPSGDGARESAGARFSAGRQAHDRARSRQVPCRRLARDARLGGQGHRHCSAARRSGAPCGRTRRTGMGCLAGGSRIRGACPVRHGGRARRSSTRRRRRTQNRCARPSRGGRAVPRPLPGGLDHARRGVDLSRAAAHGDQFPLLIPALGSCLWVLGRPAESAEVFDGAIEAARLIGTRTHWPGTSSTGRSPRSPRATWTLLW